MDKLCTTKYVRHDHTVWHSTNLYKKVYQVESLPAHTVSYSRQWRFTAKTNLVVQNA